MPLDQVIYIGDGASDISSFAFTKQYGGVAIGIFSKDGEAQD